MRLELMGRRERLLPLVVNGGADAARGADGVHWLWTDPQGWSPRVRRQMNARFGGYDRVIVFQARPDEGLARGIRACGVGRVDLLEASPPHGSGRHVAWHAVEQLVALGVASEGPVPSLPVSAHGLKAARERLQTLGGPAHRLALLSPGSGSSAKNWPARGWAALAGWLRRRGLSPLVNRGPADGRQVDALLALAPGLPVLGGASPLELAAVVAQAALCVGNDSGPTHLAALVGTPTVALFGPTDPRRWRPLGPRVALVQGAVACAPCGQDGRRACQAPHCMASISLRVVTEAVAGLLPPIAPATPPAVSPPGP